jgi:hypothetical protein
LPVRYAPSHRFVDFFCASSGYHPDAYWQYLPRESVVERLGVYTDHYPGQDPNDHRPSLVGDDDFDRGEADHPTEVDGGDDGDAAPSKEAAVVVSGSALTTATARSTPLSDASSRRPHLHRHRRLHSEPAQPSADPASRERLSFL